MATTTTATTNFNQTVTALVIRKVLDNLRNQLQWLQPGAYIPGTIIPGTNLIRHIAYPDLSVTAGTPTPGTPPWLTEGQPPTDEALTIQYEEFGANQAGRTVAVSDIAMAESPHELASIAAERTAFNALQTIDLYLAEVITAGTAVKYAGGAAGRINLTAAMKLTADEVRKHVTALKRANVNPFPDGLYRAIINPAQSYDLMADTAAGGWLDVARYAAPEDIIKGEIGRYAGVRFVESNIGTVGSNLGAAGVDVYYATFFGPDFFAWGDLQSLRAYMVNPGGDHQDPLAQKLIVGWKAMFGAKLLVSTAAAPRYSRLETGGTIAYP